MHHGHAVIQRFLGVFEVDLFAFKKYLSAVLRINAEKAFHKGGLTGAVFSHQRMDSALFQFKGDPVQGLDAGECLGDIRHSQEDILLHTFSLP